ncbi:hypothetical protein JXA05_04350 [Candidatus Peregrinibacteria bacterium]|nr:hypothetical protein [Candidatus Peregrinibacteria bacterium]
MPQVPHKEKTAETPSLLSRGLENNVSILEARLGSEQDLKKRQALDEELENCKKSLEGRNRPVRSPEELRDALDTVKSDNRMTEALERGTFDNIDIEYLLASDVQYFFDPTLKSQLILSGEQMRTNDLVRAAFHPKEELALRADQDWSDFRGKIIEEVTRLEQEKQELAVKIPAEKNPAEKQALRKRLDWIEGYLPQLRKQTEARSPWSLKRFLGLEKNRAATPLTDNISPDILEKTRRVLEEARDLRLEQARLYLRKKFEALENSWQEKSGAFSPSTCEKMEAEFNEFRHKLIDTPQDDPELLKKISDNLDETARRLRVSAYEMENVRASRPEIENGVKTALAEIESVLRAVRPENISGLIAAIEEEEKKRLEAVKNGTSPYAETKADKSGDSAIFQKKRAALEALKDGGLLRERIAELKKRLESGGTEPEELQAVRDEIATVKRKLGPLAGMNGIMAETLKPDNETAKLAHETIGAVRGTSDISGILKILNDKLGKEHLLLMPPDQFRKLFGGTDAAKKKKRHTGGFMVLRQKGDEWQVIIDAGALEKPENSDKIRKQVIHELLHLEFEKHADTRKAVMEKMTEDPAHWQKIRAAFLAAFPDKKSPREDGHWEDEDIGSELYAMQEDLGNAHRPITGGMGPAEKAKAELNNLLFGAGIGAAATAGKYEQYKAEERVLGAEEADDGAAMAETAEKQENEADESIEGSARENEVKIKMLGQSIKEHAESEFTGDIPGASALLAAMAKFNSETAEMNHLLGQKRSGLIASIVKDRIKMVEDDLKKVATALGKVSNEAPNTVINPLRSLWNNTHFFAISDIVQTAIDVYEFFKRRYERKRADHAARLGMALFGDTDLGREARARQLKAEQAEVNEWKERYENLDAWQLLDEIDKLAKSPDPSADQLKAILRILAQKGRIEWHREGLWEVLNKLQDSAHLTPGDPILHHNPSLLKQKLHKAMGAIWDYDEYLSLQRENESGYESGVKKYMEPLDNIQDQITARLDQLLAEHKAGKQVDPQEYEACMVYSIEKGKSEPEIVMFHLMAGQARGLLSPERGMALDRHLNSYPATQWIYNKQPPLSQHDYLHWCEEYFKEDYEACKMGEKFKNFYWTVIQNDPMTIQRVRKAVSERKWDHDWGRAIASMGDANTAKRFLSGRSGAQDVQDTAVENATVGTLNWFQENTRNFDRAGAAGFARQVGFFAMMDGIGENVAFHSDKTMSRYTPTMLSSTPREAGMADHGEWTTRQFIGKNREFADRLDGVFFPLIRNNRDYKDPKDHFKAIMAHLEANYAAELSDVLPTLRNREELDEIFNQMDAIVKAIVSKKGEAFVRQTAQEVFMAK